MSSQSEEDPSPGVTEDRSAAAASAADSDTDDPKSELRPDNIESEDPVKDESEQAGGQQQQQQEHPSLEPSTDSKANPDVKVGGFGLGGGERSSGERTELSGCLTPPHCTILFSTFFLCFHNPF